MFARLLKKKEAAPQYMQDNLRLCRRDEAAKKEIFEAVREMTMIGPAGVLANIDAVEYLNANNIKGALVECGVWRGGSVKAMLMQMLAQDRKGREVWLFDTFAGMTAPGAEDTIAGKPVQDKFDSMQQDGYNEWCLAFIEDVKANLAGTGYPEEKIHFVKGDVCETIPETDTGEIALLRLDTDWYESTKAELENLYDKVVPGGVIIIDDFGRWDGARKAVEEFFAARKIHPLLARTDTTRRMFLKV